MKKQILTLTLATIVASPSFANNGINSVIAESKEVGAVFAAGRSVRVFDASEIPSTRPSGNKFSVGDRLPSGAHQVRGQNGWSFGADFNAAVAKHIEEGNTRCGEGTSIGFVIVEAHEPVVVNGVQTTYSVQGHAYCTAQ